MKRIFKYNFVIGLSDTKNENIKVKIENVIFYFDCEYSNS